MRKPSCLVKSNEKVSCPVNSNEKDFRVNLMKRIPLGISSKESVNPGCQFLLDSLEILLCWFAWGRVLYEGQPVLIL